MEVGVGLKNKMKIFHVLKRDMKYNIKFQINNKYQGMSQAFGTKNNYIRCGGVKSTVDILDYQKCGAAGIQVA